MRWSSGVALVVVGGLMVSRLPTFSFKKGRVPRHLVLPALLGAALAMGVHSEFAVDRTFPARTRLHVPHSLQLAELSAPGPAKP